jgi:hypothetical protein
MSRRVNDIMSEQLNKLKQKAEQVKNYLSVLEIPQQIEAILISDLEFKKDKRDNEACYLQLQTRDKKIIVQKYTQTNYAYLYDAIVACGGLEKLKEEYHTWKKERVGRSINERLFPMPNRKAK